MRKGGGGPINAWGGAGGDGGFYFISPLVLETDTDVCLYQRGNVEPPRVTSWPVFFGTARVSGGT